MTPVDNLLILATTRRFPDPMKASRIIRGVLYGNTHRGIPREMQVEYFHSKQDHEPYYTQRFGLQGYDHSFVPKYRRELFHGLVNNQMRQLNQKRERSE